MFISGSITDAAPGPALHTLLATALTTAGFTLVDTVTISTRTHKVWKSPAAGNAQNLDWYLDIGYTTTGAGTISLIAFEYYDPATDLGYRGPYAVATTTIDAATGSRFGASGYSLENSNWSLNASISTIQASLITSAFGYWISITPDRVILLVSQSPSTVLYAGFYEPDPLYAAKAGGLLYPLVTGKVDGNSSSPSAALTRVAPWTSFPTGNWAQYTVAGSLGITPGPPVGLGPATGYPFTASKIHLSGVPTLGSFPNAARWGWFRDVYGMVSSGVVRGDTCTIGGATYVLGSTTGNYCFGFKAA